MFLCSLAVTPVLSFVDNPLIVSVDEDNLLLSCTVTAEPLADSGQIVHIQDNGMEVVIATGNNTDSRRMFTVTGTVRRFRFPQDNGTVLQCRATNDNGPEMVNVTVVVQGELYLE